MNSLAALLDDVLGRGGLPEPLPADPLPTLAQWQRDAVENGRYAEPTAMVLATASADAVPSARVVLCKAIEPDPPGLQFFTNYQSRKARDLDSNPRAAAVFYWPHAGRQARVEGIVARLPDEESDRYFATRPLASRLGAWASDQSRPLASRGALAGRIAAAAARFGIAAPGNLVSGGPAIPRPAHWGGYRLSIQRVELWASGRGRLHDRALWTRSPDAGAWSFERLNP